MSGKIYFLSNNIGAIKIGYSRSVPARLADLQTSSPTRLDLIASIDGTHHLEKFIHRLLAPHRTSGEWFLDCDAVRTAIADLISAGPAVLGYVPKGAVETACAGVAHIQLLARIVEAYIEAPDGTNLIEKRKLAERQYGLSPGVLWNIRYKPERDIRMSQYEKLKIAATDVVSRFRERLNRDAAAIQKILDQDEASDIAVREAGEQFRRIDIARDALRAGADADSVRSAQAVVDEVEIETD